MVALARTSVARRTAELISAGALTATLGATLQGCLIDPKKDYPVAQPKTGSGGAQSGGTGTSATTGSTPEAAGGTDGGAPAMAVGGQAGDGESGGAPVVECTKDDQCTTGETCVSGDCTCTPCQPPSISVPAGSCLAPDGANAEGLSGGGDIAAHAIDADDTTAWGSGDYSGHLVITFPIPQPAVAIALLPDASPNSSVDYTILVEGPDAEDGTLNVNWKSTPMDPWMRAALAAPRMVTKVTIDAQSKTTWIAIREVATIKCVAP